MQEKNSEQVIILLKKIFPQVDFCIDTFLYKHFNIKFNGTPSRIHKQLLQGKLNLIDRVWYINYFCMDFKSDKVNFYEDTLTIAEGGYFYKNYLQKSSNSLFSLNDYTRDLSKEEVNSLLSKQIFINNSIINKNTFLESDFFEKVIVKNISKYELNLFLDTGKLSISYDTFKDDIVKYKLSQDLIVF